MERFLLYLDDLDDAIFAVAFLGERGGQFLRRYLFGICGVSAAAGSTWLALSMPLLGATVLGILSLALAFRFGGSV